MTSTTTTPTPSVAAITFDCADALVVGRFWAAALDRTLPEDATSEYVLLPGEPTWAFAAVPEPKLAKNRVHVDLDVADLPMGVERLVALGATRLGEFDEQGYRWTTLADPEGNEFDIVAAG
jgi:hypothetical protein